MGAEWITLAQQSWNGLVVGMAYVLFALGLTLIFGVLRVMNLAHGEFFMLGAMFVYVMVMQVGVNFFIALIVATLLTLVVGLTVNKIAVLPLLADSPLAVFLSTLAVSIIAVNLGFVKWGANLLRVDPPISGSAKLGAISIEDHTIVTVVLGAAATAGVFIGLARTGIGRAVRATAQNRIGASLVGINVQRIYSLTFGVAAALAGLAGGLVVPQLYYQANMGQLMLLKGFAVVVIAGMGNVPGCVAVGLGLGLVEALFAEYASVYYRDAFAYALMIAVLLWKPQGFFGVR